MELTDQGKLKILFAKTKLLELIAQQSFLKESIQRQQDIYLSILKEVEDSYPDYLLQDDLTLARKVPDAQQKNTTEDSS